MSVNLNINAIGRERLRRPPLFSDLNTWHKGISGVDFAESINNLPAKFLPRNGDYNGTDDFTTFDNLSILSGLTTATFLLKFKSTDADANQYLFAQTFNGQTFNIRLNSGIVACAVTGSSAIGSTNLYNDGVFNYVVLVLNGSDLNLFVNITDEDSANDASALSVSSDDNIMLGARGDNGASAGFCECQIACAAIFNYAFNSQQITDFSNGIIPNDSIFETYPTGSGDYEYDISSNENHGTINGTGNHFDYDENASIYLNTNGYSLWQKAANPDIQVPLNRSGTALSLTAGVDIPTGYTKTRDVSAAGNKWNMADSLVDMEYGSILQCDTAGRAYANQNDAYGLVFDGIINKKLDNSQPFIQFNGDTTDAFNNINQFGYFIILSSTERMQLQRSNAAATTSTTILGTAEGYINFDTDYRFLIWRNETVNQFVTGAIGTFVVYIQGKSKSITNKIYTIPNTNEMELVDVSGGSGTNPVTDNTYITSNYIVTDYDAGDQISKIEVNGNYISPYDFTVSTGTYSIIDNALNAIFNRTNATRQTAASRASLFYDANFPFRYQINEIADPRIYDTFFEAAYQDRIFGKVLLSGSDLIRYDEQSNYATKKAGSELVSALSYNKLTDIYP